MLAAFVPERPGGNSPAPPRQDRLVRYAHVSSKLRIEINFQFCRWRQELVAHVAVLWLGRNSRIRVVTGETNRVTVGNSLKCALL